MNVVDLDCPLRMNRGIPQTYDEDDVRQEERLMRLRGLRVIALSWVSLTLYYREFGDRIRNRAAGYPRMGFMRKLHSPCAAIARVETRDLAKHFLALIEPIDRKILILRYWQNMELSQIASHVGLSTFYVSRRIQRALRQMRDSTAGVVQIAVLHARGIDAR